MAHEQQLITKRAWLGPGGPQGFLTVASSSLRWAPQPGSAQPGQELRIALSAITNNQRAKDKPLVRITVNSAGPTAAAGAPPAAVTHHVFQFESVADRDAALDVLTKVIAAQQAAAAAANGGCRSGSGAEEGTRGENAAVVAGLSRQQRQQMLERDADLRALWEELVGGGAVGEADFWSGVASRLAAAGGAPGWGTAAGAAGGPRRRVGLSNILQRVEAEVDGRHQRVLRVSLSPQQVAQIFAEQPAVLRAYRQHVPHRMTEEDFWRRYVRHEMYKEGKRKARAEGLTPAAAAAAVVDDAGGDIFREAAAAVAAEAAARPGGAAAALRARGVDPSLNLAASEGERYVGFGLAHAATREPELDSERRAVSGAVGLGAAAGMDEQDELATTINRHGEVVLQGVAALAQVEAQLQGTASPSPPTHSSPPGPRDTATTRPSTPQDGPAASETTSASAQTRPRHLHSSGLTDLQAPALPRLDSLSIANPRRYFERIQEHPAAAATGGIGGEGMDVDMYGNGDVGSGAAASVLAAVAPGCLPMPPMDAEAAEGALLEATPLARALAEEAAGPGGAPLLRPSAAAAGGGVLRDPASSLPPDTLHFLRRTVLAVNEAARHFWRCLPAHNPVRRDKAARLVKLLETKRGELEALNDRARGSEGRFIRQLLKPPMDMLLAALVRWDEEQQKRPGGTMA